MGSMAESTIFHPTRLLPPSVTPASLHVDYGSESFEGAGVPSLSVEPAPQHIDCGSEGVERAGIGASKREMRQTEISKSLLISMQVRVITWYDREVSHTVSDRY